MHTTVSLQVKPSLPIGSAVTRCLGHFPGLPQFWNTRTFEFPPKPIEYSTGTLATGNGPAWMDGWNSFCLDYPLRGKIINLAI